MTLDSCTQFALCGYTPIKGPLAPVGYDPSVTPEYSFLLEQMRSRERGATPDWAKVALVAKTILTEQGKHLSVAVYLHMALTRMYGLEGFICGTQVMQQLLSSYWMNMFPALDREKARKNTLSFWIDDVHLFKKHYRGGASVTKDTLKQFKQDAQSIDTVLQYNLQDAPRVNFLVQFVDELWASSLDTPETINDAVLSEPCHTLPNREKIEGAVSRVFERVTSFLRFGKKVG